MPDVLIFLHLNTYTGPRSSAHHSCTEGTSPFSSDKLQHYRFTCYQDCLDQGSHTVGEQ